MGWREGRVQFLPSAGVDFESGNAQQFLRRFHFALVSGAARFGKAPVRIASDYNIINLTPFSGRDYFGMFIAVGFLRFLFHKVQKFIETPYDMICAACANNVLILFKLFEVIAD